MTVKIGDINGKWSLLFKFTQVMWAIILPIFLAIMLKWGPWVTESTVLNNSYRATAEARAANQATKNDLSQVKAEMQVWHHEDIERTLRTIRDDQRILLEKINQLQASLPKRNGLNP